jgi:spermidine synthase
MVLNAALRKPEVEHVTVVEQSEDVIKLVASHYEGPRVTIVHADAMTYQPPTGAKFGAVWHDIWDDICADNLDEMKILHRRYGRRTVWQGSWARELCERYAA